MATTYVMEQRTKAAVTPRAIEDAKKRALQLMQEAYSAKPTPIDGQITLICMSGRISRGYDKLAIARRAGDSASVKKLEQGIAKLTDLYNAAQKAAENAAADWAAMAAAAGVTVDPMSVYPAQCECDACQAERAHKSNSWLRDAMTEAVYDFLAPNSFDVPPALLLIRDAGNKDTRDRIWAHLKRIADCGEAYIKDCRDRGVQPNWRSVLFPPEGE